MATVWHAPREEDPEIAALSRDLGVCLSDGDVGDSDEDLEEGSAGGKVMERSPKGRFLRFDGLLFRGFGRRVYSAYDTVDGMEVAWNEVDTRNLSRQELQRLQEEFQILSGLRHKHVLGYHNRWRVANEKVVYITDLKAAGSLKTFIQRARTIRWKAVKRWARQVLRGLHYLHSHDPPILHRNLQCSSVFINGASGEIVIGELGMSTYRRLHHSRGVGTPGFMAPEQYEDAYDAEVDIFAFGMMVLEMITGEPPYAECAGNAEAIRRRVLARSEPAGISRVSEGKARGFLRACTRAKDRPTAAELLTHPFLKRDARLDEEIVKLLPDESSDEGGVTDSSYAISERRLSSGSITLETAMSFGPSERGDSINQDWPAGVLDQAAR